MKGRLQSARAKTQNCQALVVVTLIPRALASKNSFTVAGERMCVAECFAVHVFLKVQNSFKIVPAWP